VENSSGLGENREFIDHWDVGQFLLENVAEGDANKGRDDNMLFIHGREGGIF